MGTRTAALDADGDGATNGEELGDPDGTWQQGDANPEGENFFPGMQRARLRPLLRPLPPLLRRRVGGKSNCS